MAKVSEVHIIINSVSSGDSSEEENSKDREHEEDEHEKTENVEKGREGEGNGLDKSLDTFIFANKTEDSGDSKYSQDSGDLGGNLENFERTTLAST